MSNTPVTLVNYESFALDYLEGVLSPELTASFEAFLAENPTIKEEINDLLSYSLEARPIEFPNKATLIRKPFFTRRLSIIFGLLLIFCLSGITLYVTDSKIESNTSMEVQPRPTNSTINEKNKLEINKTAAPNTENHVQSSISTEKGEVAVDKILSSTETKTKNNDKSSKPTSASTKSPEKRFGKNQAMVKSNLKTMNRSERKNDSASTKPDDDKARNKSHDTKHVHDVLRMHEKDEKKESKDEKMKKDHPVAQVNVPSETDLQLVLTDESVAPLKAQGDPKILTQITGKDPLSNKTVDIPIIVPVENDDETIVAAVDPENKKKRKFSFKNFIPESFAGLTKEDLKNSLIPEALATAK